MAGKAKTTKAETESVTVTKEELKKLILEAKEEALKEFEEAHKDEKPAPQTAAERKSHPEGYIPETQEQIDYMNERVKVIAPIDYNAPEEINLTINGETIQILRGYEVEIPRKFALVLDNMIKQQMASRKYQKEIETQVTYVD